MSHGVRNRRDESGWEYPRDGESWIHPKLKVSCPACGAPEGAYCRSQGGKKIPYTHALREIETGTNPGRRSRDSVHPNAKIQFTPGEGWKNDEPKCSHYYGGGSFCENLAYKNTDLCTVHGRDNHKGD